MLLLLKLCRSLIAVVAVRLVVDSNRRVIATVTDGDIRRNLWLEIAWTRPFPFYEYRIYFC